ncbi:hypothetical protein JX266_011034 [Neoarthrinium moseri]|nr:hypothetical protein JX266_011034 [Neoarthrinium moseri]
MSRSLDSDVLRNLKSEDPTPIYKDICSALTCLPEDGSLLEIELLGKAHPLEPGVNYLQDGNAIAVPKLRLAQAFFVARQIIQKYLITRPEHPSNETVTATAVVLLMDPEHLTAANIRKRAVVSNNLSERDSALGKEKQFIDSLLTARLHRHTKSPTLWSHRRWLIQQFRKLGAVSDARHDIATVVMVAAERHPRNYYAWQHARWLLQNLADEQSEAIMNIGDDVKEWCLKHHNDISGWMYLTFVIQNIQDAGSRARQCSSMLTDTLGMAKSFRWTNESVWVFLRTIVASSLVSRELFESFLATSKSLSSTVGADSATVRHLDASVEWARQHRQDLRERT